MYLIVSTDKNSSFSVSRANLKVDKIMTVNKPFKQTELLLKNIAAIVDFKKLKGIVVNQGPGEFSALRIGIATANALSFALSMPIVGVCIKDKVERTEKEKVEWLWLKGGAQVRKGRKAKIILPFYDKEPNIIVKK